MSFADYSQKAEDHQCMLVLVKQVGPHKSNLFHKIIDRICLVNHTVVPESKRHVWLRFKRVVRLENNAWGDFQAHRRVTGLICVGKATTEIELASIYANFDTMKDGYKSTLFDSRCFIFGMTAETAAESVSGERPGVVYFPSFEDSQQLEDCVKDFACSLFWILESKRLERLNDRNDKLPLLIAPFERKDMVGIDTETRSFRRRVVGRMRKHLADLSLMAGLVQEAFNHYQVAFEILKNANDWLWMAATIEGMCAASVIMLYPSSLRKVNLPRNSSFTGGMTMKHEHVKIHHKASTLPSNGLKDDGSDDKQKLCFPADDIVDKYKEAIMHYSKYKHAGIVEMEASIKATQVIIMQQKKLEAAEFLQNVVYINLNLSDSEKVERYNALSHLFSEIGFTRKASFFKRVAAMQCVSPNNTSPAWGHCHTMLLDTMKGYRITLDPREFTGKKANGWPDLQQRIMQELAFTARKMGKAEIAIRYMCFILHCLGDHLSTVDKRDLAGMLESYTSKVPSTSDGISLDNGLLIPPVPFTKFPALRSFKLIRLSLHLDPVHILVESPSCKSPVFKSPFIYSPLQSLNRNKKLPPTKVPFKWVADEICEVELKFYNPLPFELRVANLGFLTEGVDFDPTPAAIVLPAESGPHLVSIMGTPKEMGTLKITGYTTTVMGIKSNCRLPMIPSIKEPYYQVDIVPSLPRLKVTTSLPKAASTLSLKPESRKVSVASSINLLEGESYGCQVVLSNTGKVPVETVSLELTNSEFVPKDCFTWSEENIETQLPLAPGAKLLFTVYIKAIGDFLLKSAIQNDEMPETPTVSSYFNSPARNQPNRSVSTAFLEASKPSRIQDKVDSIVKTIEGLLKLTYSGGDGLKECYYRETNLLIKVHKKPSLMITNWTTIPATSPRQFYLVLDFLNGTCNEVHVQYGSDQSMILSHKQSKRIAILVDRFTITRPKPPSPVTPKPGCVATPLEEVKLDRLYAQQLAMLINISWSIASEKKSGNVSVEHISLSDAMIDNIRLCPIHWDVTINGVPHDHQGDPIKCSDGEVIELRVNLTNNMDEVLDDLSILVEPFQDQQNGVRLAHYDQHVACIGCSKIIDESLGVGMTLTHICQYTFFQPGLFKFSIQCKEKRPRFSFKDPNETPLRDCHSNGLKLIMPGSSQPSPATKPSKVQTNLTVWKYRPPVEILVIGEG
ncbi:trafficking protein particle complex subunit 9-like isoform X2 [Anneissia japonica]|uniref:trafficking protein particle complex subunit 9-like isoform X2 n=1 Tax=Anneissia japonica TaxID=1529436 RepID=UPI0014258687|nr:trafficking protein particle complex subunit 9-like isoform X2 [Anneissia japonica]